jgi:hypothetical protein
MMGWTYKMKERGKNQSKVISLRKWKNEHINNWNWVDYENN